MKKHLIALCMVMLLVLAPAALAAVSVVSPTEDFYVNDSAGVLSAETMGHIVYNNDALEKACGAQIVVVTIDTAGTGSSAMEEYATTLFNEWGIGDPEKDNGLLLLMAIEDDDYWMQAGSGLRRTVTAGDLDSLLQTYLEPYFAEKDFDKGAKALFDAAFAAVAKAEGISLKVDQSAYTPTDTTTDNIWTATDNTGVTAPRESGGSGFGGLIALIVVVVIVVLIVRAMRKRSRVTYVNNNNYYDSTGYTATRPGDVDRAYRRGFLFGNLLGRGSARRTTTVVAPPPPPPSGRSNTAQRPGAQPPGGGFFGSGSPSGRTSTTSRPSSGSSSGSFFGSGRSSGSSSGSIFGSSRSSSGSSRSSGSSFGSSRSSFGSSRSSSGFGRSSSGSRSFGGGRSGGGGASRGGGAGRHR